MRCLPWVLLILLVPLPVTAAEGPELIPNGGFETMAGKEPAGWQLWIKSGSPARMSVVSLPGRGNGVRWEHERGSLYLQDRVTVEPRTAYVLRCWAKTEGLTGGAACSARPYNGRFDPPRATPGAAISLNATGDADWKLHEEVFVTGSGCTTVAVGVETTSGNGVAYFDDVSLKRAEEQLPLAAPVDYACRLPAPPKVALYHCSPNVKIFPQEDLSIGVAPEAVAVDLYCARNERESFQLALRCDEPQTFAVSAGALRADRTTLPAGSLELSEVRCLRVDKTWKVYGLTGSETGLVPDPIVPVRQVEAGPDRNTVLWVDIAVPAAVPPGRYRGNLLLKSDRHSISVPLRLTVWPFTLPKTSTVTTSANMTSREPWVLPEGQEPTATVEYTRRIFAELAKRRLNGVKYIHPQPTYRLKAGGVDIDWREYDRAAHALIDEMGLQSFAVSPQLLGSWDRPQEWIGGLSVGTAGWERYYRDYLRQTRDHLRARNWWSKAQFYLWDEVQPAVFPLWAKCARVVKEVCPDARILATTGHTHPELVGLCDTWVFPWHFFATTERDVPEWAARGAAGDQLWVYQNSLYAADLPWQPNGLRCYLWAMKRHNFTGALWWAFCHWPENPWEDAFVYRFPGEGYFLYPGQRQGEGPFSSLRLENYSQGLEDYEYLCLLQKSIARREGDAAAARRIDQLCGQVAPFFRCQSYTRDALLVERLRREIGEELAARSGR